MYTRGRNNTYSSGCDGDAPPIPPYAYPNCGPLPTSPSLAVPRPSTPRQAGNTSDVGVPSTSSFGMLEARDLRSEARRSAESCDLLPLCGGFQSGRRPRPVRPLEFEWGARGCCAGELRSGNVWFDSPARKTPRPRYDLGRSVRAQSWHPIQLKSRKSILAVSL